MILCRHFSLTLEGFGTKEVTEDAFINDTFWIINEPLHDHYPIDQAFSFQTEFEDFDETLYGNAMKSFRASISIMKGDLCGLIASAIHSYRDALEGYRFTVSAENGKIEASKGS